MATTGTYIQDGTVTWIVADIRDGDRVGDITLHPTLLPGHILADGATVTASEYPRLVAWVQNNNMITTSTTDKSKYMYNNINDTLVVPNVIDKVIQGGNSVATKSAGLPNITGSVGVSGVSLSWSASSATGSGAFSTSGSGKKSSTSSANASLTTTLDFSAANSNAIYGKSNTVQPPAITQIPQIKY